MLAAIFVLTLASAQQDAAPDLRGEIEAPGARSLAISPTGDLWMGSRGGRLYVSRDRNHSWSEVEVPTHKAGVFDDDQDELDHIGFFDAKHGIIAGVIGRDVRNQILRTEDGGSTWSLVQLPSELWVYGMQVMSDGHAWLVGWKGKLLTSDDFGASWHVAGAPFEEPRTAKSVCFASLSSGAVGDWDNALKLTSDGGRTWASVPTPADALARNEVENKNDVKAGGDEEEEKPAEKELPIDRIWILDGKLFVLQREQLFVHALAADGKWTAVESEGHKIIDAETSPGGLLVLTDERRILHLEPTLKTRPLTNEILPDRPEAMTSDLHGSAFLTDVNGRVCMLAETSLQCSIMYSTGAARSWPIASFDRAAGGVLYGTSSTALYRSSDSGKSWERLLQCDGLESVSAFEDGSGVIVEKYTSGSLDEGTGGSQDGLFSWRTEKPALVNVLALGKNERSASVAARSGRTWLATAFATDGSSEADAMLRTSDTVREGPHFTALTFVSLDGGHTWNRVDSSVGSVIHSAWLDGEGDVTLLLSAEELRTGRVGSSTETPGAADFRTLASGKTALGAQWASWLAVPSAREVWCGGNFYFGGPIVHRSQDAGVTWSKVEPAEDAIIEAYRLGGGACARVVGFWQENGRVEVWKDGSFRTSRRFEPEIHDARVDATGCLLVRLSNAEVWSLSADAQTWERLGSIELPPQ